MKNPGLYPCFFTTGHDVPMRLSLRSLWRFFADGFVAFGQSQFSVPTPDAGEPAVPGHPENMLWDQPLTETEMALNRQLEGVAERVARGPEPL
ncbi:DUF6059 family protein [Streptomyces colonosanans]|uniref:DUF6059 family protein n=1 Tax=Streptomyces colonosanans TaxID=1428652 RepID=UPI0026809CE1